MCYTTNGYTFIDILLETLAGSELAFHRFRLSILCYNQRYRFVRNGAVTMDQDTDQMPVIRLKHLSPTWVKQLDEEVGKRGMWCDLLAIFRGLGQPVVARITEDILHRPRKTND